MKKASEDRYARQILYFGEEGQQRIGRARVGIVGLGGIGSHLGQGLAYLGVRDFTLVDGDLVSESNLNRVVGATPGDVGKMKVTVAQGLIDAIQAGAAITTVPDSLITRGGLDALHDMDVIFGGVDNDAARLVLTELSAAYEIVLIDCATEIAEDGSWYGGRVIVARPGDFCLDCAGQIDMERAKEELASEAVREVRRAHGYGLGELAPAASVISINGVVAHLAITEFMVMTTGLREPSRHLIYAAERPKVAVRDDDRRPDCYFCGYVAGKRDEANIVRFAIDD